MKGFSKSMIHRGYDFIETNILKDYNHVLSVLEPIILLSDDMVLLDVGGGTGKITDTFSPEVNISILLDCSREMLNHSSSKLVNRIQADGTFIPLRSLCVDIVFLIHVLHHIDETYHEIVLKEVYRVLKLNGQCYLFDLYYPHTFLNNLYTKIEEFSVGKTYHKPSDSFCSLLETIGFHKINRIYTDQKHWRYLISAVKKEDK